MNWNEEDEAEKEFWEKMGNCEGYIAEPCPKCGRIRVEKWSSGLHICEKCNWCIEQNNYFHNEFFDY